MQEKGQANKIQNRLIRYLEQNSLYRNTRQEIKSINNDLLQKYGKSFGKSKETQQVDKLKQDAEGKPYTETVQKQVIKYVDDESKVLHEKLKQKRKDLLKFNYKTKLYVNNLCQKIAEEIILSCDQSQNSNKKIKKNTACWKYLSKHYLSRKFVGQLIQGCPTYSLFEDLSKAIYQLDNDKEIARLTSKELKKNKKTVMQDLQVYKQDFKKALHELSLPDEEYQSLCKQIEEAQVKCQELKQLLETDPALAEEYQKAQLHKQTLKQQKLDHQVVLKAKASQLALESTLEKFGNPWGEKIHQMYNILDHIQSETKHSKTTFNVVKSAAKKLHQTGVCIKISNSFKHFISRILCEFLQNLEKKLDCYVSNLNNKTIKLEDMQKIIRICVNHSEYDEMEKQIDEFEESVLDEIEKIDTAKAVKQQNKQPKEQE